MVRRETRSEVPFKTAEGVQRLLFHLGEIRFIFRCSRYFVTDKVHKLYQVVEGTANWDQSIMLE